MCVSFGFLSFQEREMDIHLNNGNGETSRLQLTSNMQVGQLRKTATLALDHLSVGPRAKDGIHLSGALRGTILVGDSNVDKGGHECDVEDNGDEGCERQPGEAAEQEQGDAGVDDCGAGDAGDGSDRGRDGEVVVIEGDEEVDVDSEDDDGACELDCADEPLQELEAEAATS